MERYTVAVLVKNQSGVLNKVTSMFRRRQFNISSLTVSETESNEFSRITVTFDGEDCKKEQLIDQLYTFEHSRGLGGAVILIHPGVSEDRIDRLYDRLGEIIQYLSKKGYSFKSLSEIE